jgi:hypothetical protein
MEWTLSPTETNPIDGTLQALTTELALNETFFVFENYGIDTPTVINGKPVPDSYTCVPTGPLAFANNTWEVIAWGYDSNGVPYAVAYETPADGGLVGPSLDIISRDDNGPSKLTLDVIYDGIKGLHNQQLDNLLVISISYGVKSVLNAECEFVYRSWHGGLVSGREESSHDLQRNECRLCP